VGHVLRSDDMLYLKAGHIRVSQSDLKTDVGTTVGDARGTIIEVASGSS
jgi:hypothetical protein